MKPRGAKVSEELAIAKLWHDAWHEAHGVIVPEELCKYRTLDTFAQRVTQYGDQLRVIAQSGQPLGLCVVTGSELSQLFVSPAARGTGVAADLLADGEKRLQAAGTDKAFVKCIPENTRAIRFYEKHGWQKNGIQPSTLEISTGVFEIPCVILTKTL